MPDLPLTWDELRRTEAEAARDEVPAEYAALESPAVPSRTVRRIERGSPDRLEADRRVDEPLTTDAYRPPWMGWSPQPSRRRFTPPPEVHHAGRRLDPLFVWHPDNRTAYNDGNYPWRCVCKITTASGRAGSGVLIGPRHVLTASHCVDWNTSDAEKIEVHLQGTTAAATTVDTLAYAYTQITTTSVPASQLDEDYAVLVLADRLGDRFGWFGTKTYDSGWDDEGLWTTIGYPGDSPFFSMFPTFQRGVYLDEDAFDLGSGRAMTTNADLMPGQSGSPMFGQWQEGPNLNPYVVAVVSAQGAVWFSGDENWCSGGTDLGRLVKQARDENP